MTVGKDKVEKFGNYTLITDAEGKFISLAVKGDDAMKLSRYDGHEDDIRIELDRGNLMLLVPSGKKIGGKEAYIPAAGLNGLELLRNIEELLVGRM
jgi:hypothetical protein